MSGWICARCQRSNAPFVAECPCTAVAQPAWPVTTYPNGGQTCPRCGAWFLRMHACWTAPMWPYTVSTGTTTNLPFPVKVTS